MQFFRLNDGNPIPALGYGTYKTPDGNAGVISTLTAIADGYRLIDTAAAYGNEREIGDAIRQCGLDRSELTVTSKVANPDRGYDSALRAFDRTLGLLQLDRLDIYLIHWPASAAKTPDWIKTNADTWKAMERLKEEGAVRTIGVSNFLPQHLKPLMASANIPPAVNQIEYHPGWTQPETSAYCRQHDILLEAWSPLGRMRMAEAPLLQQLALKYGKTVAQICLRWIFQNGVVSIPKSSDPQRILQNISIFDFNLSPTDMAAIDEMPPQGWSGLHPDTIDF